jgi:hypothetical protein
MTTNCATYYPDSPAPKAGPAWFPIASHSSGIGEQPSDCLWLYPVWWAFELASEA